MTSIKILSSFLVICISIIILWFLTRKKTDRKLSGLLRNQEPSLWNDDTYFTNMFVEWLGIYAFSDKIKQQIRNNEATYLSMLNNQKKVYLYPPFIYKKKPSETVREVPAYVRLWDWDKITLNLSSLKMIGNTPAFKMEHDDQKYWRIAGVVQGANTTFDNILPGGGIYWRIERIDDNGNTIWGDHGPLFAKLIFEPNMKSDSCIRCCTPGYGTKYSNYSIDDCRRHGHGADAPIGTEFNNTCPPGTICTWLTNIAPTWFDTINPIVLKSFIENYPDLILLCCSKGVQSGTLAYTYAYEKSGFKEATPLCDNWMDKFCMNIDNASNPLCGCYPNANHTETEKKISKILKDNSLTTDPICLYSACRSGLAYHTSRTNATKCPSICLASISGEAKGDFSTVDMNGNKITMTCKDGTISLTESKVEPPPTKPSDEKKPDEKPIDTNNAGMSLTSKILLISIPGLLAMTILTYIISKNLLSKNTKTFKR